MKLEIRLIGAKTIDKILDLGDVEVREELIEVEKETKDQAIARHRSIYESEECDPEEMREMHPRKDKLSLEDRRRYDKTIAVWLYGNEAQDQYYQNDEIKKSEKSPFYTFEDAREFRAMCSYACPTIRSNYMFDNVKEDSLQLTECGSKISSHQPSMRRLQFQNHKEIRIRITV